MVCILSGGLDSVCTAAYMAKEKKYQTYMITFMYGQRAMIREVRQAKRFSKLLMAVEHQVIDLRFLKELYGKTNSLTNTALGLAKEFDYTIVVPVRNAIFITIAAAWAMSIKAKTIAYGAHLDDISYPDCRPNFIKSIANVLNLAEEDGIKLGLREKISIWSPALAGINKAALLKIGYGILADEIFSSWSCYSGGVVGKRGHVLHCGVCESCINRKVAINKAGIKDKTHYANNCKQGPT